MSKKSFKLSEIADFLGGQLVGDDSKTVFEIKTLLEADKGSISFIYSKKFKKDLEITSAAAVIISQEYLEYCNVDYILVENPHESYAKLTQLFSGNLRNKFLNRTKLLITKISKFVPIKHLKASSGVQTMGSPLMLKEVFIIIGTFVFL